MKNNAQEERKEILEELPKLAHKCDEMGIDVPHTCVRWEGWNMSTVSVEDATPEEIKKLYEDIQDMQKALQDYANAISALTCIE